MNNKLQAKDLINIGIFTAIYFVVFFATGMVGYIPVMMLVMPFLCPFMAGIPLMLFLTKVHKFGMITIMGLVLSILMILLGHPWVGLPFGILFPLLADLILKSGQYTDWQKIKTASMVFSLWIIGQFVPFFFMRDSYFATLRAGYGDVYADTLMAITPLWVFFVIIAFAALGGLAGALLGKSVLKKHFQRAGIA
ncbi:MAG: energy-coupling factor transport system substrate-specific component [Eubacteriaceae bacterium]|jgi:energy-coupling factor transport system substrate-specific component|nr:energy-coupling factor transport system substrate-specific component [Eubacteriaceae bacterium]MDK2935706.1 energy-coupling factor transport system substrate-specific component [Eubacteriaceae bacterium]